MDKVLSFLRLEFAKGSRTKYGFLLLGILLFAFDRGWLSTDVWNVVDKYDQYILAYFGIEHLDGYFRKGKK